MHKTSYRVGPVETRKLSFRSCVFLYRLLSLAKTDAENCNAYPRLQTDSGGLLFTFVDHGAASGELLTCA